LDGDPEVLACFGQVYADRFQVCHVVYREAATNATAATLCAFASTKGPVRLPENRCFVYHNVASPQSLGTEEAAF